MDFKKEIAKILTKEIKVKEIEKLIETPPNKEMGDYAFPCFILSKKLKKAPNQIAQNLAKKIKPNTNIKEIKATGPYLNFFINNAKLTKKTLTEIFTQKQKYGYKKPNKKIVLVEFPGPNTNKPLHLGHLRNLALGQSISNILETQGNTIKKVNINNDRGIHVCKSMLAYQKWGKNKQPNKKSDHFVGDYYVMFSKKTNKKLEQEAQEMLIKWETGDKNTLAIWKKMNKWALEGFKQTYKRFGIKHNKEYYESETYKDGKKIVLDGLKKKIFTKNKEGAVKIDLGNPLGEKILLRPNGTAVYITQDLYLAQLRYKDYKFNKCIYVVGNEQNYHFNVLFTIFKKLKFKFAEGCHHLSYGLIELPEGKMKSREGTVVDGDNLMDQLKETAKKEITKRKTIKTNIDQTSEKIGLAALKYYILKHAAYKNFTFNPKESISLEGNTGPYILYSLVRATKIQYKIKTKPTKEINFNLLNSLEETTLIKKLSEYSETLEKATAQYSPHLLAEYTYKLASLFNLFYEKKQVTKAENKETKKARLFLTNCYSVVIKSALNILGISEVKEM